jgi:hypothetical protein
VYASVSYYVTPAIIALQDGLLSLSDPPNLKFVTRLLGPSVFKQSLLGLSSELTANHKKAVVNGT